MSLFQRFPAPQEFAPLFRVLDEFSNPAAYNNGSRTSSIRAFQPRFDVRELKNAYELHGELPGIEQENVQIEFTDPHTLVIKGRAEREFVSGTPTTPAAGQLEGKSAEEEASTTEQQPSHQPTVEDEAEEGATSSGSTPAPATPETSTTVAESAAAAPPAKKQDKGRYWVSERSVGEFHRSFSFPSRVEQDAVKASLKNGILSVVVPKAAAHQTKRIEIE